MTKDIEIALREAAAALPAAATLDFGSLLAERAAAEGLLDVAYATVDSPLGPLVVAATPRGLVRLAYTESGGEEEVLEDLAGKLSPRILEDPERLDEVRRELDEYFDGRRDGFDLPIDWSLARGFIGKVLRQTADIPFGETSTYAEVARGAGSARAVRAAGNALGANPIPVVVPCHRVLRTGGALGGYTGGAERKEFLLRLEGVLA
ncbi:MAG: methylated-DNA-[protein]-cysteine S-methyltransferase [Thermoleophilaceae bacterium]|nr:methylated-DNA-[protein]-cysteine S-methyltransferase [Thermoleophilaceae bacterium]